MGFPAYLLGLSLPLIGGVALGIFLASMFQQNEQSHQNTRPRTRRKPENIFHQKDSEICPICLGPIEGYGQTSACGHKLHTKCLVDLYKHGMKKCPQCRENI